MYLQTHPAAPFTMYLLERPAVLFITLQLNSKNFYLFI